MVQEGLQSQGPHDLPGAIECCCHAFLDAVSANRKICDGMMQISRKKHVVVYSRCLLLESVLKTRRNTKNGNVEDFAEKQFLS